MWYLLLALIAVQVAPVDPVSQLWTYGSAFAGAALLGGLKKYTTIADSAIGKVVKPVQPALVFALAYALPRLIHGTPNVPDPAQLVAAPTATLAAVVAAEIFRRVFPSKP